MTINVPIDDNCLVDERSDDSKYCLRSVHVINVRDAYEIFCAIEYINVQKIQHIPN
jgi:hypothetical protein